MAVRLGVGMIFAAWAALAAAAADAGQSGGGPQFEWLQLDRHHVKWGTPRPGSGSTVTYAFVSDAVRTDDARNCRSMVPLDGLLAASAVDVVSMMREVRAAFDMWQAVADIRFVPAPEGTVPDILIGAQAVPRGVAFADVAYEDDGSGADMRRIRRSLICLNPEKRWMTGFDGDRETYDLRYAIAHEIGHAIGLDHAGPSGQLMSFRYDEQFRDLQAGDVAGASGLYGSSTLGAVARSQAAGPGDGASAVTVAECRPTGTEVTALAGGGPC